MESALFLSRSMDIALRLNIRVFHSVIVIQRLCIWTFSLRWEYCIIIAIQTINHWTLPIKLLSVLGKREIIVTDNHPSFTRAMKSWKFSDRNVLFTFRDNQKRDVEFASLLINESTRSSERNYLIVLPTRTNANIQKQ